jgi:hypothetical protein
LYRYTAQGVNEVQRRLFGFKAAQNGATAGRVFVQAMRDMAHPSATIKMHHATIHHEDDLVDLVEVGGGCRV